MRKRDTITGLALFAAAAAIFANSLGHAFVWDDIPVIRDNAFLAEPGAWSKCFLRDFGEEITGAPTGYYRPLVFLSFILNHATGGLNPFAYHLTNVLLHGLITALLFCLVGWIAGRRVGLLAAVLFAVHPVHTESVAFVAGRSDLLCTFFMLLTLLATIRSLIGRRGARPAWSAAAVVAYAAALLSKELAIALPAVMVCYGLIHRYRFRNIVRLCAPATVVAAVYLGLRLWLLPMAGFGESGPESESGFLKRAAWLIPIYASQQVLPVSPTLGAEAIHASPWVNLAALVLLALLIVDARPRRRAIAAAVWLVVFLLPPLWVNLFKGIEPSDRFAYAPSMGTCVLAALVAARYWEHERLVRLFSVLVLGVFAATSFIYSRMWRNPESLWRATVAYHPRCGRSHYNLGNVYFDLHNPTEAVKAYRKATKLLTDEETLYRAYANLARILADSVARGAEVNRLAIQSCRRALRLRPHRPSIRHLLGVLLAREGDHKGALRELEIALRDGPDLPGIYVSLARECLAVDPPQRERAAQVYRRGIELGAPPDPEIEAAIGPSGKDPGGNP